MRVWLWMWGVATILGIQMAHALPASETERWDATVSLDGSYPLGGGLNVWLGYNKLIWGQKKADNLLLAEVETEKPMWHYGYLRPHMRLFTNYYYNRGELRFDLYPISVFGLTTGGGISHRNKNKSEFDCASTVSCKSLLYRWFVENNLKMGVQGFFLTWTNRVDFLYSQQKRNAFAEEGSNLLGQGRRDQLFRTTVNGGYNFDPQWRLGAFYTYQTMLKTRNVADEFGAFVRFRHTDQFQYQLTVSAPDDATSKRDTSVNLKISWVPEPSFAL